MKYTNFNEAKISRLGFGTMRLPMDSEGKIDFEAGKEMVDYALSHGITYFDTAYKYHGGEAEIFCREALTKRHPRESYYLADKLPTWLCNSPAEVMATFEEQLEKCGVEHFDFYLIHNVDEETWPNICEQNMIELMAKERDAGRITHLGLSVHCEPPLLREIMEKYSDVLEFVQIQLNYMDWDYINAKELYSICREYSKPMIIMEPVRGGMLANPLSEKARRILDEASEIEALQGEAGGKGALQGEAGEIEALQGEAGGKGRLSYTDFALGFVDQLEGVAWTLSGMSTLQQMKENIEFFNGEGLSEKQIEATRQAAKAIQEDLFVPCTGCNYCFECPQEIPISKIFKTYNEAAAKGFHCVWSKLSDTYKQLGPNGKDCIGCGNCESHCPQKIKIIDMLKQIDDKYAEIEKLGE